MALSFGFRLSTYEILSQLGSGGMGEVYRAKDTKLGRDIALKILPATFTNDPERVARFRREAQVLASLNHSHIAQIHGMEEANGTQFLVLELVDGESLDKRIARGRIPVDDALAIARQIAEALEAAHEKGIIHRDLKPANIALTTDGSVKVLDFGLAKAVEATGTTADLSMSPTVTSPAMMTGVGVILGTAAYMSPEQAKGKSVDKRSDVWAFGAILFEMLTGKPAFAGETLTDIVAAVVKNEPDWSRLPADATFAVRSVLRRCLRKDPAQRLRDIGDARLELDDTSSAEATLDRTTHDYRMMFWRAIPWALCVGLTIGVLRLTVSRKSADGNPPVSRVDVTLPESLQHSELFAAEGEAVAISRDGTQLALVLVRGAERQVYHRRMDRPEMTALRGTDNARVVCFSPDGHSIAFVTSDRSIKTLSIADGLVKTVAGNADNGAVAGITWTADDRIVYVRRGGLWEASLASGAARQLTTPDTERGEVAHRWPYALPTGSGILFTSSTTSRRDSWRVEVVSTGTGRRQMLIDRATYPMYAASGHLLFLRDGSLLAAPFDATRLQLTGSPIPVELHMPAGGSGGALLAVSDTGSLVAAPIASGNRLVWVSRNGAESEFGRTPQGIVRYPRIAPDGRRVAISLDTTDLWVLDSARATSSRLTNGQLLGGAFLWTPDSNRIVFVSSRGFETIDANGGATAQPLPGGTSSDSLGSLSRDGKTLAILRYGLETSTDVYLVPMDAPIARPLLNSPAFEGGPQFSPDGRWLAYVSNETGRFEVYVRPYPAMDRKWPVSTDGGTGPVWNRNGRELFYRNGAQMMAVDVSTDRDLSLSAPKLLFEHQYSYGTGVTVPNYDVSADGQRFLMVKEEAGGNRVQLVLNWFEELRARVPTK